MGEVITKADVSRFTFHDYRVKDWDPGTFPALFRCADEASKNAQKWYLRWAGVNLGLLVLGAVVGSISLPDTAQKRIIHAIAAGCFFLSLATSILLATRRWEKVWYTGRAVAESVKTLTWKFMTGADPFSTELNAREAVESFTNTLRELVRENGQIAAALSTDNALGDQVTELMTGLREAAVGVKRDLYLAQRVNEQQAWYASNSKKNRKTRNIWFGLLVSFQALALASAIYLVVYPTFPWRAAAVFTTLASATVAWGQFKRYQELAQAYGLAAQELSLIAARGPHIGTREQLARFVNDAETAISREHATWVARRETK